MFIITTTDAHKIIDFSGLLINFDDTVELSDVIQFTSLDKANQFIAVKQLRDVNAVSVKTHF